MSFLQSCPPDRASSLHQETDCLGGGYGDRWNSFCTSWLVWSSSRINTFLRYSASGNKGLTAWKESCRCRCSRCDRPFELAVASVVGSAGLGRAVSYYHESQTTVRIFHPRIRGRMMTYLILSVICSIGTTKESCGPLVRSWGQGNVLQIAFPIRRYKHECWFYFVGWFVCMLCPDIYWLSGRGLQWRWSFIDWRMKTTHVSALPVSVDSLNRTILYTCTILDLVEPSLQWMWLTISFH